MFDLFKKEIKIGDPVKLYLTTGKEPEGVVVEIGDSYVLLQENEDVKSRYFDKIVGGWNLLTDKTKNNNSYELFPQKEENYSQEEALALANNILNSCSEQLLNSIIGPNVNIFRVQGSTCIASNNEFSKITVLNNRIIDLELIEDLKKHQFGEIFPIACLYYIKKQKELIVTAAIKPQKVQSVIEKLIASIHDNNINSIHSFIVFLKIAGVSSVKLNKLKRFLPKTTVVTTPIHIPINNNIDKDELTNFKIIEKELNKYIKENKHEIALEKINHYLNSQLTAKYKSSLLLKKAQLFSSLNKQDESEKTYNELISYNKKHNSIPNNLSHLYSELARLQSLNLSKLNQAIQNAQSALKINPRNIYAENLLKQLQSKSPSQLINDVSQIIDNSGLVENLIIEDFDESFTISKLIDIDLEEHKFTDSEVISNNGKPTPIIAKRLLETAKEKKEGDLSDRYPLYLEAAKSFKDLNIGSYDSRDYLEAIAFYSMLKGNSLFIKFRSCIQNNDLEILRLTRLKDSSCSYFIEALNLMSNIKSELLLSILNNYLKLNIVLFFVKESQNSDLMTLFKGQFADTFNYCINNNSMDIRKIAYETLTTCGASSINTWNKLTEIPKKKVNFTYVFSTEISKNLLNEIEPVTNFQTLRPQILLKSVFENRKKKVDKFLKEFNTLNQIEFSYHNISDIQLIWDKLTFFEFLLSETDMEIKMEISKIILILQPYLNRNQTERTNILIQARAVIERALTFISGNTTYYGRSLFYGLLKKWKTQIDHLLEERIAKSNPVLEIIIDPPYLLKRGDENYIPIIAKNIGESTSSGFNLRYLINSTENYIYTENIANYHKEIPSGAQIPIELILSKNIPDHSAVNFKAIIAPIYQNKVLEPSEYSFTLENEPDSSLTYDDIPWKDGPIPTEQMFKGRRKLVMDLAQHYLSMDRDKPYILYGLTRTGKSSILQYLRKELEDEEIKIKGEYCKIITFFWDMSEAASQDKASDFYYYTLYECTYEEILKKDAFSKENSTQLRFNDNVRFKDFKILLEFLHSHRYYPVFLIDEFSFIRNLMDKKTINSAYLHALRQFSLNEYASFVFSGTYDIKQLIKDEKYGITGQLVNTIEHQVNEIKPKHAEELIKVIDTQLSFTKEAINYIMFLSGNVPYFIQIICKNCGYYAVENKRQFIGYPELVKVVDILTGKIDSYSHSLIKKLPEGAFQNNQFSPQDPKEVACLISTIEFLNRNNTIPRGISYGELEEFWAKKNMTAFRPRLAEAITLLKDKKILYQYDDESIPVYKLAVDLFRLWWSNHHPDLNLVFNPLIEE